MIILINKYKDNFNSEFKTSSVATFIRAITLQPDPSSTYRYFPQGHLSQKRNPTVKYTHLHFWFTLSSGIQAGPDHLLILTNAVSIATGNRLPKLAQTTYFHGELSTEDFIL